MNLKIKTILEDKSGLLRLLIDANKMKGDLKWDTDLVVALAAEICKR